MRIFAIVIGAILNSSVSRGESFKHFPAINKDISCADHEFRTERKRTVTSVCAAVSDRSDPRQIRLAK